MNTEFKLFQMRQSEMEQTARRERQANELRKWRRQEPRRESETEQKRNTLISRISVLF